MKKNPDNNPVSQLVTPSLPEDYKLIKMDIDKPKPDPDNPNIMDNLQIQGLKTSFQQFGKLQPIIIDQDFIICDGEHRWKALKELGEKKVDVYQVNLKSSVERRLLRQTFNKLRGKHDTSKDSLDILRIFEAERLKNLQTLLGKPNLEDFKVMLSKHQGIDFMNEDGSSQIFQGALEKKYGQPPFTILDTMTKTWRDRKEQWVQLGLLSYEGREHLRYFNTRLMPTLPSISIYDPVLCEIMYRWFTPHQNSLIIDPFSGGTTRGMVASFLGHRYVGIDLSPKQIEANEKQYERIKHRLPKEHVKPVWIVGDSLDIIELVESNTDYKKEEFDMLQTSPPYYAQEIYSKDTRDLNQSKTFKEFIEKYTMIIDQVCKLLKPTGSFVAWNTTNTRDKSTGEVTNIISYITDTFRNNGFIFLNDLILVRAIASLHMLAPKHFRKFRYCGQRHENVLVYFRGKDKREVPPIDLQVVDVITNAETGAHEDDILADQQKEEEQEQEQEDIEI